MRKSTIALACACAALLAGCGSSSSSSTSAANGAAVSRACATARAANARYGAATRAQSSRFRDQKLAHATIAATAGLQTAAEELARVASPAERAQASKLADALSHQKATVGDLLAQDLAAVRRDAGNELNNKLAQGLANLARICPGA